VLQRYRRAPQDLSRRMGASEGLPLRARICIDELLDQRSSGGRATIGRVQSLDLEPELFKLGDRGSPAAELARPKRTQIRMLMSVRSRNNWLRVISALLVQKYNVARG
jgi:hypothetical protein